MTLDKMVDMIVQAYRTVMGDAAWNGKTDKEKHDIIMSIAQWALEQLEREGF